MRGPLELSDWIRRADERGLVATVDDLVGSTAAVPLEYCAFRLYNDAIECAVLLEGNPYPPVLFFTLFRVGLVEKEAIAGSRLCLVEGELVEQTVSGFSAVHDSRFNRAPKGSARPRVDVYAVGDDRQARSDSGGFTRYILWSRLESAGMPPVYWRRPIV